MSAGVATRAHAAGLVRRVTDEGAHSNVLLAADAAAHATLSRLVLDTLRYLPAVDATIAAASSRPLQTLDPEVRSVLRVAVMELMTGGDPHGVVHSAVEVVKREGVPQAAGFVNGVLREVGRGRRPHAADAATAAAWAVATPPWIRQRLAAAWGDEEADDFLRGTLQRPAIGVRNRQPPGIGEPVPGIPTAAHVTDRREVTAAGDDIVVMDPASVAVALAVGAEPGHTVLDVAAAPGNKTAALWDAMDGAGLLVAADRHRRRVRNAARRTGRLGVRASWVVADGMRPPFRPASFDRILIDAPCTGLGTVRRRPEIKSHLEPDAPARMAQVQRRIVEATRRLVRPGGRIVYAVCTVFPEETVDIAAAFDGRAPGDLPGRPWGGGLLLAPHITGTDGMFISVFG